MSFADEVTGYSPIKVSLKNFHGIEINDFACSVARTALWIAEKQADTDTFNIVRRVRDELPLTNYGTIHQGNALRIDWNEIIPANECTYICGNPPFIGHQIRNKSQQDDMNFVFKDVHGYGKLDYVCAWYKLAADYMHGSSIQAALVSTNSICQGESVSIFWQYFLQHGLFINFAYTSFIWDSQADEMAHVHVVIVGFSYEELKVKLLFTGDQYRSVNHINGYLAEAPDVFIANRGKPINKETPEMTKGSQPTDGGNLILTGLERKHLISKYPILDKVIKPFIGGREFLNGENRWCLWFVGANLSCFAFPEIAERLHAVQQMRLSSPTKSVRQSSDTPHLFTQIRQPKNNYLALPEVSSGKRRYFPIGYMDAEVIASNQLRFIPTDSLYVFGLLSSLIHASWIRAVAGRLKSDYRYSPAVYNSFVFPNANEAQKSRIELAAQEILKLRTKYHDKSLANLYNPDYEMFYPDLYAAHHRLDEAVESAYGISFNGDEEKIVSHLFRLYDEKIKEN